MLEAAAGRRGAELVVPVGLVEGARGAREPLVQAHLALQIQAAVLAEPTITQP